MPRTTRTTTKTAWRERVGYPPFRVIVHERDDGAETIPIVYLKWRQADGKRTGRSLRRIVRLADGRLDRTAVRWCRAQAKEQSERLLQAAVLDATRATETATAERGEIRDSLLRIESLVRDLATRLAPSVSNGDKRRGLASRAI